MNGRNNYRLRIDLHTFGCIQTNGIAQEGFVAPDTKNKLPKIYVVKDSNEICYVGVTTQSINARLKLGFAENGNNGYHGYKWRRVLKEADLLVWAFPDKDAGFVEAVEGELVYLIRRDTGKWPKYQMEIHFHPDATEEEQRAAGSILNELMGKQ